MKNSGIVRTSMGMAHWTICPAFSTMVIAVCPASDAMEGSVPQTATDCAAPVCRIAAPAAVIVTVRVVGSVACVRGRRLGSGTLRAPEIDGTLPKGMAAPAAVRVTVRATGSDVCVRGRGVGVGDLVVVVMTSASCVLTTAKAFSLAALSLTCLALPAGS